MCGVAGIYRPDGAPLDRADGERMIATLTHRGPDDSGVWVDRGIVLAHQRLAILDLSPRAAQPMRSADGRYVLSYNGEIFNFQTLRSRLEARGVTVRSSGDTEVLLEHIAAFGVEATLPELEGDWAFALWDARDRVLVLARDRHGVKPLYYTVGSGNQVRFASEVKALLDGGVEPDLATVNATLLGLSGTWGEHTMIRGINAVRPGEWLRFDGSTTPQRRTFFRITDWVDPALSAELDRASEHEVLERLAGDFETSMDLRMISDAPLACLVSGGVDSNLVAAAARKRNPDLALYHADVVNDSERPAAEALARELGLELRVTRVSDDDFLAAVAAVTWANDTPLIYHLNSVPFYLVSELAHRDGIKVLLTGEGSDEYFIGYPQYALAPVLDVVEAGKRRLQDTLHAAVPRAARLLWPKRSDDFAEQLRALVFRFEEEIVRRDSEAAVAHLPRRRDRRYQAMALTLVQEHLVSLLHRNDRLGMAWSLESRFPFLGHDLARTALNLPGRYKLRRTRTIHDRRHPFIVDKWAVRALAERYVPSDLARREKQGFPVSIAQRLRIDPRFYQGGFVQDLYGLDQVALERLHASASRTWATRLLLLEVWGRLFVLGRSVSQVQEELARGGVALAG